MSVLDLQPNKEHRTLLFAKLIQQPEFQQLRSYILERASFYNTKRDSLLREEPSLNTAVQSLVYTSMSSELQQIVRHFDWILEEAGRIYKRRETNA